MKTKMEFLEEYRLSTQDVIKGRMISSENARKHIQSRIDEIRNSFHIKPDREV